MRRGSTLARWPRSRAGTPHPEGNRIRLTNVAPFPWISNVTQGYSKDFKYSDYCVNWDGGKTMELKKGDIASFPKGTRSSWTVVERIEKFTVVSG